MVNFTFKPFKSQKSPKDSGSAEEPPNPYQKRREQVRRAQRSHRERKEAYIKSLEAEVIQLRANEAKLFQETKLLYTQISAMKNLLAQNGIPGLSSIQSPPRDQGNVVEQRWGGEGDVETGEEGGELFEFSVTAKTTKESHERIVVRRRTRKGSNERNTTVPGSEHSSRTHSAPSLPSLRTGILTLPAPLPMTFDTLLSSSNLPSSLVSTQDPTAIGMDFILSLEAPCLGHIPHTPSSSSSTSSPSGHALMASATLLHFHSPPTNFQPHTRSATPIWTVPESGVQRLLELARNIPLDGEVTPVQAWAYIRQHPQYRTLKVEKLEAVKRELVGWVKCYEFGGVVPQDVFEDTIRDLYA